MSVQRTKEATILGLFLCLGLIVLGLVISKGALKVKSMERTVAVKGLSEREIPANTAIWPIRFNEAANDLTKLSTVIQKKNQIIISFLKKNGFTDNDISISAPDIVDKQAQRYVGQGEIRFRYSASSTVSVYTKKVDKVVDTMKKLVDLAKQGIATQSQDYGATPQFIYTDLNTIKPEMIEEATKKARQVAEKFARDSNSKLGKIKKARQGQFSINDRDSNTPYIKKIRVVSTVEYYLSD